MDSATADLICSLQLQDLADIQASRNRERPRANGDTNVGNDDAALALRLYCEELRANASVTADHHFGEAIGRAEDPDAMPETRQPSATPDSDSIFARSFAWLTCSDDDPASETPETTSDDETAASGDCIVCLDHYRDLMTAPCGDHYCKDDIMQLFDQSLTDESLFPPRCCRQAIPIDIARPFLTPAKADEFEAKSVELSIVNRTYCHDHSCAKFIPPTKIADHRAICDHCGQITCALCKLQAHDEDCPDDPAHQTFMAAAQAAGFQKCYQCKRMVELDFGCNHMTCLCRAEFCYVCGERWKTCQCNQWNEQRLLARAEQIAERAPAANEAAHLRQVEAAAQRLRERHECEHTRWRKVVEGNLTCEQCYFQPGYYLLECRQCEIRVCVRCRRNRL